MNSNVMCIGKLCGTPSIKDFEATGKKKASFSLLLSNAGDKKADGTGYEPAFPEFEAWDKQAEFIERIAEEKPWVSVVGTIKSHSWEDTTTGQKRTKLYFLASSVNYLPGTKREVVEGEGATTESAAALPSSAKNKVEDVDPFADI